MSQTRLCQIAKLSWLKRVPKDSGNLMEKEYGFANWKRECTHQDWHGIDVALADLLTSTRRLRTHKSVDLLFYVSVSADGRIRRSRSPA